MEINMDSILHSGYTAFDSNIDTDLRINAVCLDSRKNGQYEILFS